MGYENQLKDVFGLFQKRNYDKAARVAAKLVEEQPQQVFGWKILGAALYKLGKVSESLDPMQKSVLLDPADPESHNNLASCLLDLGELEQARYSYSKAIELRPDYAAAHSNLGLTLFKLGLLKEAESSITTALALNPNYIEAHYNLGNIYSKKGRFNEAIKSFSRAVELDPHHSRAIYRLSDTQLELGLFKEAETSLKNYIETESGHAKAYFKLGNIQYDQFMYEEAKENYRKSLALEPNFVDAHNNLGITLQKLGQLKQSEICLRKTLELKPDYSQGHNNLGNTLVDMGRLEEADAIYTKAVALDPGYAEAYYNLGNLRKELGKKAEAISLYANAINLNQQFKNAYINLGHTLRGHRFEKSDPALYQSLCSLLLSGTCRPKTVSRSIISLLKKDPNIKELLIPSTENSGIDALLSTIDRLDELDLLGILMRLSPIADLDLEALFVNVRKEILEFREKILFTPVIRNFLTTLSLQCFINEHIYFETEKESQLIEKLTCEIERGILKGQQPNVLKILCLSLYRPLHKYDWCTELEELNQIPELKRRLVDEPELEKKIAKELPSLKDITDRTSLEVQAQYQENPYPRWINLTTFEKGNTIHKICDGLKLRLSHDQVRRQRYPKILVAGCGTGQHSIEVALYYDSSTVIAVDLSLASLAYAQRKTTELGVENVTYLQADILDLRMLELNFDVIESSGVLHHMRDPYEGWSILYDTLNPGGLMKIALYSQIAREGIAQTRKEIIDLGIERTQSDIKSFRNDLIVSLRRAQRNLIDAPDFYTTSEVRDLIFHVQEHNFTLLQIQEYLDRLGLIFCGFCDSEAVSRFVKYFGAGADVCDLSLWHRFELSNPRTFAGMYQFYCQKPM